MKLREMVIKGESTFPQRPKTGVSQSDCLMSYQEYSLGLNVSYPFEEMQSAYSAALTDWTIFTVNNKLQWAIEGEIEIGFKFRVILLLDWSPTIIVGKTSISYYFSYSW